MRTLCACRFERRKHCASGGFCAILSDEPWCDCRRHVRWIVRCSALGAMTFNDTREVDQGLGRRPDAVPGPGPGDFA